MARSLIMSENKSSTDELGLLVVAFHFPPVHGSSGYLRTLKFVRYLPEFGIRPTVLTVNPKAYPATNLQLLSQIPAGIEVKRSFALDVRRHFSIRGKYPGILGIPDRWSSWIPFGIRDGHKLIREKKLSAIFSTYPIPSAHLIGSFLAKKTGLPWIADFRDPMWDEHTHLAGKGNLKIRQWIEERATRQCSEAIVTTQGMVDLYRTRYPSLPENKITFIPNGYDEEDFQGLEITAKPQNSTEPIRMIHAGLLEPVDRDPVPFFKAIKTALASAQITEKNVRVDLFASGNEDVYQRELENLGLEKIIKLLPAIPYSQVLQVMAEADILLLFQGPTCDSQVPAKLYEYMRIGRPILALTTPNGNTGKLVESSNAGIVVSPENVPEMTEAIIHCILGVRKIGALPSATKDAAGLYSRRNQAKILAERIHKNVLNFMKVKG